MRENIRQKFVPVATVLIAIALLATAIPLGASIAQADGGTQTWYLTDIQAEEGSLVMNKRAAVSVEKEVLWKSDETGEMKFQA